MRLPNYLQIKLFADGFRNCYNCAGGTWQSKKWYSFPVVTGSFVTFCGENVCVSRGWHELSTWPTIAHKWTYSVRLEKLSLHGIQHVQSLMLILSIFRENLLLKQPVHQSGPDHSHYECLYHALPYSPLPLIVGNPAALELKSARGLLLSLVFLMASVFAPRWVALTSNSWLCLAWVCLMNAWPQFWSVARWPALSGYSLCVLAPWPQCWLVQKSKDKPCGNIGLALSAPIWPTSSGFL